MNMKKLIDPSDDALNEAFAVEVAGWTCTKNAIVYTYAGGSRSYRDAWKAPDGMVLDRPPKSFTSSADAVLPWLEKRARAINITYCDVTVQWTVEIVGFKTSWKASSETLPRAIVYALLLSNGIEIQLT